MIYYEENGLRIRDMEAEDISVFVYEEMLQGWFGVSPEKLEMRLNHRDEGKCVLLTAEINGEQAGYVSVYWNAPAGAFADMNIPEIVDFNVLEKFRGNGYGWKLMDVCEELAAQCCDKVCLGVGLYKDYGRAQRMYVKRGYIPDGSGVWYQNRNIEPYEDCVNDDDLVLYLSKDLK